MRRPGMRAIRFVSVPAMVSGRPFAGPARPLPAGPPRVHQPGVHRLDFVFDAYQDPYRSGADRLGFSVRRIR
jgi:hypothetical protein